MKKLFKTPMSLLSILLAVLIGTTGALATSMTDYYENRLVDVVFRGQTANVFPASLYVGLQTVTCTDSSVGTEVTGGAYARVAYASSLTNWAGTQSSASTTASTGTSGTTSNNGAITFPAPTANWGSVVSFGIFDAGSTTLSASIASTGATSMSVTSAAAFPASGNYDVIIDSEIVTVTAGQGTTTWTITRGVRGTTAATHSSAAPVSGMLLFCAALTASKTVNNGDAAPAFNAAALTVQVDN